jgi:hypothetical protein
VVAALYAAGRRISWLVVPVCLVAPLANPYGWNLHRHVFAYLTDSELLARIGEFQSFDFHTAGSWQIMAALMIGMAGGAVALQQRRWERFGLALAISAMALRSARGLPLAALMLLPLANAALARAGLPFAKYAGKLREHDTRFRGPVFAITAGLAAFALLRYVPAGFPKDQFPVDAYPNIPLNARLFAPDKFGGYLIYRSNGNMRVFFDGRSDFYGRDFLKSYGRMVQLRPGWRAHWDSFGFTHALLPVDFPLVDALGQMGWREVYRDKVAVLMAKPGTNS